MLQPWLRQTSGVARSLLGSQRRTLYTRQLQTRPHNTAHFASYPQVRHLQTSVQKWQDHIPLRQQLKREAKTVKSRKKQRREDEEASREKWELTVGIEIHAQLNTDSKLFSRQ